MNKDDILPIICGIGFVGILIWEAAACLVVS